MTKSTWQVVPPNAAAVWPDSTSSIVTVPAERHVQVRVRVDCAGQHVLAGGVDDLVGLDVERLADQRDALALDVDVADVVVGGGDDPAAFDQYGHGVRSLGSSAMPLDPKRTVAELRELQELTGDENGAQRVAWTDTWVQAQDWMASKLDGIEMEFDEARNQWWTLRGASDKDAAASAGTSTRCRTAAGSTAR